MLAPNMLPAASSAYPERDAPIAVDNSGRDVAPANRTYPTHSLPKPILYAITSAAFVKKVAENNITIADNKKMPAATGRLIAILNLIFSRYSIIIINLFQTL